MSALYNMVYISMVIRFVRRMWNKLGRVDDYMYPGYVLSAPFSNAELILWCGDTLEGLEAAKKDFHYSLRTFTRKTGTRSGYEPDGTGKWRSGFDSNFPYRPGEMTQIDIRTMSSHGMSREQMDNLVEHVNSRTGCT